MGDSMSEFVHDEMMRLLARVALMEGLLRTLVVERYRERGKTAEEALKDADELKRVLEETASSEAAAYASGVADSFFKNVASDLRHRGP
jgi:hypothetical protein